MGRNGEIDAAPPSSILQVAWGRYLRQLDRKPLRTKARLDAALCDPRDIPSCPGCTLHRPNLSSGQDRQTACDHGAGTDGGRTGGSKRSGRAADLRHGAHQLETDGTDGRALLLHSVQASQSAVQA